MKCDIKVLLDVCWYGMQRGGHGCDTAAAAAVWAVSKRFMSSSGESVSNRDNSLICLVLGLN